MMKNKRKRKKTGIRVLLCAFMLLVSIIIAGLIVYRNEIEIAKLFKDWDRTWTEGDYEKYSDLWLAGFDSNPEDGHGDEEVKKANAGFTVTHKIDSYEKLKYEELKGYLLRTYSIPQSFERLKPDAAYVVTCITTTTDIVMNTEEVYTQDMLVLKYHRKWYLGSWLKESDEYNLRYNL